MKFIEIYFVICILWKKILAERLLTRTDYFDGLINYLRNESKLYRVIFILENKLENTDPMLNLLIKEVNQHFPSVSSNYNQISICHDRYST